MAQQMRCLVIEDSSHDQKVIKRAIAGTAMAVQCEFATTLGAAKTALGSYRFPVILCDNNLPDGSGLEFALELVDQPAYRNTTIAIISGWPSPFMWAKAKAAGLQIIDKNDQPQIRLVEIFKRRLQTNRPEQAS